MIGPGPPAAGAVMRTGSVVTMVVRSSGDAALRDDGPRSVRAELQGVVDRLLEEYRDAIPAGSIIRCVARCTELATRSGVPRPALAPAVERLARATLDGRTRSGPPGLPDLDAWLPASPAPGRIPAPSSGTRDESCVSG